MKKNIVFMVSLLLVCITGNIASAGFVWKSSDSDGGRQISGIVTDQKGGPVEGIWVYATDYSTGEWGDCTRTRSDGSYIITGLLPGTYKVYTEDSLNCFGGFYSDTDNPDSAAPVEVTTDQPASGTDFSLVQGGQISGVVKNTKGVPVNGIRIDTFDFSTGEPAGTSLTLSDGSYTIKMLQPGTYRVFTGVGGAGFFEKYYNNKYYYDLADPVNVSAGQTTPGMDFVLEPGEAAIEAGENIKVVFSRPMDPATVNADTLFVTTGTGYYARTVDGTVTYAGLTATFIPGTPLDEYPHYAVTVSTDIKDINGHSLQHDYTYTRAWESISGRVSDARNETPVQKATVYAYSYPDRHLEGYTSARSDGSYVMAKLSPGKYKVYAKHPDYINEYYDNTPDTEQATPVEVIAGQETSGTDFRLDPGGQIRGTVTGPNGELAKGILVCAQNSSGYPNVSTYTQSDGSYAIKGLVSGTYRIYTENSASLNYIGEYYKNTSEPEQAVSFEVADQTISGIHFSLEYGGQITGRVTDSRGRTVKGDLTCTDAGITFTPTEVPDYNTTYIVTIGAGAKDSDSNSLEHDYTWSFTTATENAYTLFRVISVCPFDDAVAVPVDTVITAVFSRDINTTVNTDTFFVAKGAGYNLETVPGTVDYSHDSRTVRFTPSVPLDYETGYSAIITAAVESTDGYSLPSSYTWYFTTAKEGEIPAHPEVISTVPGSMATGIMPDRITATFSKAMNCASVKDAFSMSPDMGNLRVKAYDYNGGYAGSAYTQPDGSYAIKGLYSGDYKVSVDSSSKGYLGKYYDNAVKVTVGQVTGETDFNLEKGGQISGNITDTDGKPVTGLGILVYDYSTGDMSEYIYNGPDGSYVTDLLPAGYYRVMVRVNKMNYLEEFYNNAYDYDSADPVEVNADRTTSGTDFVLEKGEVEIVADTSLNGVVTATFSSTLDPATINENTFFVETGTAYNISTIPGKVTYSGTTATFVPAANLEPDTGYTVVVTSDVKDLSGNPLQHDYTITFKTGDVNKGDINGDQMVDLSDAILALNILAGIKPSANVYKQADVNSNGIIGQAEVIYILQEAAGITGVPVSFPDINLEETIRQKINKPSGDILKTDLQELTYLSYSSFTSVKSIEGLQYCTNLTELHLYSTWISDISALAGLTKLTQIWFNDNEISDISALTGLTKLTQIWLINNEISDISALAGLTNLTKLSLGGNQISDTSTVAGLTSLIKLGLDSNQISDISALAGLTNLTELYLSSNQISDISALTGLTNLTELYLRENQINDISVLAELTNLTELYLNDNQISDISVLAELTNLTKLYLGDNQISDISALTGLTNLTELYLGDNQISDISALAELTNLTELKLGGNQVSDISALAGLTNLTELDLSYNQIIDISVLTNLPELTELELRSNQISNISAVAGLTNLTELDLCSNQVSDISALSDLTNLKKLYLYGNQISDIKPLVDNTGLGTYYTAFGRFGDAVSLYSSYSEEGNPLSTTSCTVYIPQLEDREVIVRHNCP
ncbi:MAG: hypothetical protein GY795_00675 [Desulfobacterales bacterium]|nr:hypothetical protein [Desulfobacterales bacterium]